MTRLRETIRNALRGVALALSVSIIVVILGIGFALVQGYRPVIILTGSMTPAAPTGSVIVARPVDHVAVGDILVMRQEQRATITHRIVEIELNEASEPFAVTRGDANSDVDAAPYPIGQEELIGRWVIPEAGHLLLAMRNPLLALPLIATTVLILSLAALRRIWRSADVANATRSASSTDTSSSRRRTSSARVRHFRQAGLATVLGILFAGSGVAWSLYLGVDTLPGNVFTTSACYDARLQAVQTGQVTNSTSGTQAITMSAVDTAAAFLLFSTRSNSNEPDESQVMGRIINPTTVEFTRTSDGTPVPSISIEWSVVEYACGVSVQRGTLTGDSTNQIDVPITTIDPTTSFVLGSSAPASGSSNHEQDDLQIFELIAPTTLRIRSAGAVLDPGRQLAWQVITFDAPGDANTQIVSTTLGAGAGVDTLTLATPVDPDSSFLLASVISSATGPEIGERMVRVKLVDSTTVEVVRLLTTESIEIQVQVVELLDGTTVRHGQLDLAPTQLSANATFPAIDISRSVAFSPVLVPGSSSGGSTDFASDDIVGEGSVTVEIVDPTTITVTRGAAASSASFSWQLVTWGGPRWADLSSPFRQRIDITAGSVDSPSGYTTPLTFDHLSLVDSGISLASGDDVRIWRFDGTTWIELDRVLDDTGGWAASDSKVWFRTQEAISADTTISYWLYLGDPTPGPVLEDPANVWLATEGFEGAGLGFFEDRTSGGAWYRALPWTRRIILSINQAAVDNDLGGETVLVRIIDADLATWSQPDGSDIRFTASDGTTKLPHTVEDWDPITGSLSAWVTVPLISSSSDTTLHLYYGAADAPAQADPRSVWVDDLAVWNFDRDPAGPAPTLQDAGQNSHDGLALGNPSLITTGTGLAVSLDGTSDRLESAPFDLPDSSISISAWFRADTLPSTDPVLIAQGDPASAGIFELAVDTTTTPGTPFARFRIQVGETLIQIDGGTITTGAWHHLVATWDGSSLILYLDGVVVDSIGVAGLTPNGSNIPIVLGGDSAGLRTLDGALDQVRVGGSSWTASRVRFMEANLRNPGLTVTAATSTGGSWFGQGDWTTRRPLTVAADQVAGSLSDYPLLVQLADVDLAALAQSDGDDLVFVSNDGTTRLDHQIESWNSSNGTLTAWVRIPTLDDTSNTHLFLYLGNPSARNQDDPVGVWGPVADLVLTE